MNLRHAHKTLHFTREQFVIHIFAITCFYYIKHALINVKPLVFNSTDEF